MTIPALATYTLDFLIRDTGPRPLDLRPVPTPDEAQSLPASCGCLSVWRTSTGALMLHRPFLTDHARLHELTELHAGLRSWLEDAPHDDPERPAVAAHLRRLRWQRVQVLEARA